MAFFGEQDGQICQSSFTVSYFCDFLSTVLMCRGKAVKDFKGPDCRFVNFKEGESIYVYYKLIGRTNELWAGSVGNVFGYFPKDLLEINHIYTHDELELPTDETDFVCFGEGKDDFDNYDVNKLLKLSKNMEMKKTKSETIKEEVIDWTVSTDPEIDHGFKADLKGNEDYGEHSTFLHKKNENVEAALDSKGESLGVSQEADISQGDENAHQPSEEMLQETLQVPKHESAKNHNNSQGETEPSDYVDKNDAAHTLLHREVSEDLKTTFGSTADAFVSDDETTSLVTSQDDDDFREELDIYSYDIEKQQEPETQSEKITSLSLVQEEIILSKNPEAEKLSPDEVFESEANSDSEHDNEDEDDGNNNGDNTGEAAAKLQHETKDDSAHLGDNFFADVSEDERIVDITDDQTGEEGEEEALFRKQQNTEHVLTHSDTSTEDDPLISEHDSIKEQVHDVNIRDLTGETDTTQYNANENAKNEELTREELPSTSTSTLSSFAHVEDQQSSIKTIEEILSPPLDINVDPEGLSLNKIMKDSERGEEKSEDNNLEKMSKTDEKDSQQVNIVLDLSEDLMNKSLSDLDDGKTKYDAKEHKEDFELTKIFSSKKQSNISAMGKISTEKNMKVPIEQPQQGTAMQDLNSEKNDITSTKKTFEKKTVLEKSKIVTQHRNHTQHNIDYIEDDYLNTEKSLTEFLPIDLEDEDDDFIEEIEEELLQDENAESAKLSKEQRIDDQSFKLDTDIPSPQLQMPNNAILKSANPVDEIGEEAMTLDQAKEEVVGEEINEASDEAIQLNYNSQQSKMKRNEDNEEKMKLTILSEIKTSPHDKIMSSNLNTSEPENRDYDFSQRNEDLSTDFSEKVLKLPQTSENHFQNLYEAGDTMENSNEHREPKYSESVTQLLIIKEFLDEKRIARLEKYLGQQHLFKIEHLFHDMELELMLAQKHSYNQEDTEKALDQILESSESNILDIVSKILDARELENKEEIKETDLFDEEAALMDDIQELMYSLRQKYSPVSESVPLLVSTLPENMQPGPDFHGFPWEPIIITAFAGIATLAIFFWRTCLSVMTEAQLAEKIKTLLKEKTEILEKLSEYEQKERVKEAVEEGQKENSGLAEEIAKLKDTNKLLDNRMKNVNAMLEEEKKHSLKKQEEVSNLFICISDVELLTQVQIALNEAKLSEEKVKSELHRIQEENMRLKKSKEQLLQEAEGWSERHAELSEQIKLYQKSQKVTEEALARKENETEVLTNCIMQLKQLDADSESEDKKQEGNDLANGEISDSRNAKMKAQIKQMMDVSRVYNTLIYLIKQIKKLEHDSCSTQTVKSQLESECKMLQQKVEILNELYQQKEMALQKKLTQEEYERQEKEQTLSAADEKAVLAIEEVKIYKQRIQEMEEELQKTERSYKNQIAAHEKKAHENWLAARSAERVLVEEKRESASLRQKIIEVNQKIASLQRPIIVKPTAGLPDHQTLPRRGPLSRDGSFGPSPVSGGAPSPPLMMEPPVRPPSANPRDGSRGELTQLSGKVSETQLMRKSYSPLPPLPCPLECSPRRKLIIFIGKEGIITE
uniref:Transport and Golgi organization protein 1 homolog n=1 Tax=Pseudonaja textilis TaxID=8673 RepID=A0A670ZC82_PSETE